MHGLATSDTQHYVMIQLKLLANYNTNCKSLKLLIAIAILFTLATIYSYIIMI